MYINSLLALFSSSYHQHLLNNIYLLCLVFAGLGSSAPTGLSSELTATETTQVSQPVSRQKKRTRNLVHGKLVLTYISVSPI